MPRSVGALVLVSLCLVPTITSAQIPDVKAAVAKCVAIVGNLERLDCYDAIGRTLPRAASETSKPASADDTIGKWKVDIKGQPRR
jgi:hypothetical protein